MVRVFHRERAVRPLRGETGQTSMVRPDWYALYVARERTNEELQR
jgi:hypothetical protein